VPDYFVQAVSMDPSRLIARTIRSNGLPRVGTGRPTVLSRRRVGTSSVSCATAGCGQMGALAAMYTRASACTCEAGRRGRLTDWCLCHAAAANEDGCGVRVQGEALSANVQPPTGRAAGI